MCTTGAPLYPSFPTYVVKLRRPSGDVYVADHTGGNITFVPEKAYRFDSSSMAQYLADKGKSKGQNWEVVRREKARRMWRNA